MVLFGFAKNSSLAREAGRMGGEACKKKYGPLFYREIGRKGGETVKRERGSEFYSKIGSKGGLKRAENIRRRKACGGDES